MLTYFPTPYPGEWWYSVLCRYHVRSGRRKFATTKYELYGKRPMTHGRLFPGCDCYTVIKQLPEGILSLERALLKHTLMPYYLRFHPLEKKRSVLQTLLKGGNGGLTSIQILTPEGKQGLKFCPLCYTEDVKTYGEPYWHREHQIPLMSICPKHHCKLRLVEIALARLSEVFLPLGAIPNEEPVAAAFEWEKPLADALFSILMLPFETELPEGYSNLENKLRAAGFGIHAIRAINSLDAEKLRHRGTAFYGSAIGGQYFSKLSPAIVYRICRWKLTSPERYALLSVMAGLTIEELFGDEIQVEDPL